MNKPIYIASTMCPVGCGEVMYLQGKTNRRVFCYCTGCAIAFPNPKSAQFNADFEMKHLEDFSPDAVIFPEKSAIVKAGFGGWIFGETNENQWYSEQEVNDDYLSKKHGQVK